MRNHFFDKPSELETVYGVFCEQKKLVNIWSLLFQKGTQRRGFTFFSVFLKPFLHFKRYDHDVYIFFNLWNISDKTVEPDFWFKASKKFSRAWSSHVDKVLLNTTQNLRICFSCQSLEWWKSNLASVFCRRIFFTYLMML